MPEGRRVILGDAFDWTSYALPPFVQWRNMLGCFGAIEEIDGVGRAYAEVSRFVREIRRDDYERPRIVETWVGYSRWVPMHEVVAITMVDGVERLVLDDAEVGWMRR